VTADSISMETNENKFKCRHNGKVNVRPNNMNMKGESTELQHTNEREKKL
jgi:hypothetical protein